MNKPKLVVAFIPAFNEEEKIGKVIETVHTIYSDSQTKGFELKIIVVDDGSSDHTVKVARQAGVEKIVSHTRNLGLGAATRTGMRTAYEMGADIALKLDADFQHDPHDIEKVIRPILADEADIVYGSRFSGNITYRMPFVRRVGNRFFTRLMKIMTGWEITDAQTGLMVYSRRYLAVFDMVGDYNPPQQTLIDAYHKHMRYAEVPVTFHPRTTGKSFVSFRYPFRVFVQIVRILALANPLKIFVPAGFIFTGAGLALFIIELLLVQRGVLERIHDGTIIVFIIFGVQVFFFGLLADLIVNKR